MPQVNHIDENKKNNTIENLEWCTSKQNNNYGTRNERIRPYCIENGMKYAQPVAQYSKDDNLIKEWTSLREVERELHIPHSNIVSAIKRNSSAGGFVWKFIDNKEKT